MSYQQLTEGKRYQISTLLELGISISEIALKVKCHGATVYRELKRNRIHNQYCPKHAHASSVSRRKTAHKYRIPVERIEFVRLLISIDWSPEQIASVLTKAGASICQEWIYRYIAQDKRQGGKLYHHLRQGHKRYRKGLKEKALTIKNAVSIDERPSIVDNRERFGDWEIDTVLGKHDIGAIVTLGYALNPDGSMHPILVERLETTLAMAKANPDALIVLTGGVPMNHKTEGKLMADWLIEKGINKNRIIEENYATSTVDNALFSSYALARHHIKHATIISSASHVRRGQTLFEIASWQTGPQNITFDTVSYPDKPLKELATPNDGELLGIYRDALRTYGMWSYRSYPLESR
ncbi:IS30 family transposase [Photobacterium leiognathi]|uniref:IS30 family transposase n=1 Tax=Photobacterium leiognathi TaxID=553611 RepID=UPI0027362D51|nr:IS30 family transposase [Photobacterium leiognathi]